MYVSDRLVEFVASSESPPWRALEEITNEPGHPLAADLSEAMSGISPERRAEALSHSSARILYSTPPTADDEFRLRRNVVAETAGQLAYEARAKALMTLPPRPYEHPALAGVVPDEHQLVSLQSFERNPWQIQRAGYVFQIAPSLAAANSSYWLAQLLRSMSMECAVRVRLDPFMVASISEYCGVGYAMRVYGRPLDWARLEQLQSVEHAEWMPDDVSADRDMDRTQLAWEPRDDGLHFRCEELPMDALRRPGRYAHAIYDPAAHEFTHADGGVRFYTPEELQTRRGQHVRNAGKSGTRIKLFSFDEPIPRDAWCNVIASLYVWNEDIREYFTGKRLTGV